jgi:trk system potassium uptake protein TrkH
VGDDHTSNERIVSIAMWQRYTFHDFRVIAHYLGVLIIFIAGAMLIPFVVACVHGEWEPAARYLFSAGSALCIGLGLRMLRIEPGYLNQQQALAVTGLSWVILALISAIPLALCGHFESYYDALFDCVSAYTATGVSIISDLDHLSNADNMWRFTMHFAGGLGLVVIALSLGAFGKVSTSSLYTSEGRSEHVLPNVVETARFILKFSLRVIFVSTVALTILLVGLGMCFDRAALQSLWLSISGFMTAGFSPMSNSVTYYHSELVEWVLMLVMLIGGFNFSLHGSLSRGHVRGFFKDIEVRSSVIWWTFLLVILILSICSVPQLSNLTTLVRTVLFNFVSAATTTGFVTLTPPQMMGILPSGAALVLVLAMAIGGSSGSTTGGIKIMRVGIIAKSAVETMKIASTSESARIVTTYNHIGRHVLHSDTVRQAMTVFILFVITYTIGALIGIAYGYDAIASLFESVAMASNSGIASGISTPDMPFVLKTVYMVEMWAGRLEFVTLVALGIKIVVSLKPRIHLSRIFHRN